MTLRLKSQWYWVKTLTILVTNLNNLGRTVNDLLSWNLNDHGSKISIFLGQKSITPGQTLIDFRLVTCPMMGHFEFSALFFITLRAKEVNRIPFFPVFSRKITAFMPIFYKKMSNLQKTCSAHTHILSKTLYSLKNTVLSCIFFSTFLWKTPCCHAHNRSKKRQFWQN